jgi:ketosteroid isomerase-like protein
MTNNKDAIRAIYDALAKGDVPTVLAGLAGNVVWTQAEGFPYTGTYHGPQAVLEGVFMRLGSEWDRFTVVPEQFVAETDTVVAIGTYAGKYKKTGKAISVPFVHVWKLKDGKAITFRQHTDTAVVQKALK